jgi:hypothetical protein
MLGGIAQLFRLARTLKTIKVIQRSTFEEIFEMDKDGDGAISKQEYCLFMLKQLSEVDPTVLAGLEAQFDSLDTDKSGELERSDFPKTCEIRKTLCVYDNEVESVEWEVVKRRDFLTKVTSLGLGGLGVSTFSLGKRSSSDSSGVTAHRNPVQNVFQQKSATAGGFLKSQPSTQPHHVSETHNRVSDIAPAASPTIAFINPAAIAMADSAKKSSPLHGGRRLMSADPLHSLENVEDKRFFV